MTEIRYFSALRDYAVSCSTEVLTDIIILQRHSIQSGFSDPIRIVELTDDYLRMLSTGVYSEDLFIGKVIDSLISVMPEIESHKEKIKAELRDALESGGYVRDGDIYDTDGALICCKDKASSILGIGDFAMEADDIDYDESLDTICLVVDRDRDGRDESRYFRFIEKCNEHCYKPFITNPRFELWLLLHFDIESDIHLLKDEMKYKSTMKRLLRQYGMDRKDIDCRRMVEHIPDAVRRASAFCCDLERLECERSTNLPSLMRMIFSCIE